MGATGKGIGKEANTPLAMQAVILAGGQGTRFWPLSRMKRPKQFLSISENGESLIQATARRVGLLVGGEITIVTNILHQPLIREHVPHAAIIAEPVGRNTAASIGLAAIACAQKNPDTVMIVLPADHAVADEAQLNACLKEAAVLANAKECLVTLGIKPTSPNTGYGYIKRGRAMNGSGFEVARFYEKPNLERAKQYYEAGTFYWNSGMFVWRARVILEAIKAYMPPLYEALERIRPVLGSAEEQTVIAQAFESMESISIDFGVLEHARNCAVIPTPPFGWNDIGSWDAWAERFTPDERGNFLHGDTLVLDSTHCVAHSGGRLLALLGVEDLVVIDSGDAVLVCPRSRVQDVKRVVEELTRRGRKDLM
jgi:mannose-1-phosphate guanylyltransferase